MQSAPAVPFSVLAAEVPRMMFVPAGQSFAVTAEAATATFTGSAGGSTSAPQPSATQTTAIPNERTDTDEPMRATMRSLPGRTGAES